MERSRESYNSLLDMLSQLSQRLCDYQQDVAAIDAGEYVPFVQEGIGLVRARRLTGITVLEGAMNELEEYMHS